MEPIHQAILDNDIDALRKVMRDDPSVISLKSKSGRTPIQLAYTADNYPACATLLKHTPKLIDEIDVTVTDLLEYLIANFSQTILFSNWSRGIEYDLWALVIGDDQYTWPSVRYQNIDREYLDDIRWIASRAEGWVHRPEGAESPEFITNSDWEDCYQKRKTENS